MTQDRLDKVLRKLNTASDMLGWEYHSGPGDERLLRAAHLVRRVAQALAYGAAFKTGELAAAFDGEMEKGTTPVDG
jgi:hypothetical protein